MTATGLHVLERLGTAAVAAALSVAIAACGSGTQRSATGTTTTTSAAGTTTTPSATTTPTAPTTAPSTVPPTTAAPTTSPTTAPPAASLLHRGDTGAAVRSLQQRLTTLGYWLGAPNGVFGDSTQQAVYALQKVAGLPPDGVVGPLTAAALAHGAVPTPRSTSGTLIEVDLHDDVVLFVRQGRLTYTLNTSTGGGYTYTDNGVTAVAETPTGQFRIYRQIDGMVTDSLGQLWRPKYFTGGFALHGDSAVPPEPVSHGCVRVSNEAIDWIWSDDLAPLTTEVWVYS